MQIATQKVCPQCHSVVDAQVGACPSCGHIFRTQFVNPNQTQAYQPGMIPPGLPAQPPDPYAQFQRYGPAAQPGYAGRDEAEWKAQTGWLWFLTLVCALVAFESLRWMLFPHNSVVGAFLASSSLITLIVSAGILTFTTLRLRRLYKYDAPHRDATVTSTIMTALFLATVLINTLWISKLSSGETDGTGDASVRDISTQPDFHYEYLGE